MNKVVTHIAVGVAGIGLGFSVGYLIQKKQSDKRIAQVEAAWMKEYVLQDNESTWLVNHALPEQEATATPIYDTLKADTGPIKLVDQASELEDELPPDFPEETLPFTVEGQAPALTPEEFIQRFKDRNAGEYGGVSFPGQTKEGELDADQADVPVRSVPDFVTVRDPAGPYVISIDEYMEETEGAFTHVEMTYFSDNVVVDSRGQQVPISTVGQHNTSRFGEGTTDPEMVYVRNERLAIDIELTRDDDTYTHSILGQQTAEQVARSMTKPLRMRESDGD